MQLTETLEPYIFKYFVYTSALRVQCEYIIAIDKVPIVPLIALSQRVIASRLCERTFSLNEASNLKHVYRCWLVHVLRPNRFQLVDFVFILEHLSLCWVCHASAHMLKFLRNFITIFYLIHWGPQNQHFIL